MRWFIKRRSLEIESKRANESSKLHVAQKEGQNIVESLATQSDKFPTVESLRNQEVPLTETNKTDEGKPTYGDL